jgi:ubiquinone/menaquinone biosynthesis C-methylase UbiE
MANLTTSRRFWDQKAKENPYWYVSSFGPYAGRDLGDFWRSGEKIWAELKERLGYQPDRSDVVVEIGCGVGRLTRAIVRDVNMVHAFDLSDEMLHKAKEFVPSGAEFHLADGCTVSVLPDSLANLVLAYCVFQHLPSKRILATYLTDMARVARPDAIVAFTLSPKDWRYYLLPFARAKSAILAPFHSRGPKGLYKKEWIGIRPSISQVHRLAPIRLQFAELPGGRWLFWGRKTS